MSLRWLGLVIFVAAVGAATWARKPVAATPAPVSSRATVTKCGWGRRIDRLCVDAGEVQVGFSGSGGISAVSPFMLVTLPPYSDVTAPAGAAARVAYRQQATCRYGYGERIDITTRYTEGALFAQRSGIAYCQFRNGRKQFFVCDETRATCPVAVHTNGGVNRIRASNPVILDVCIGHILVKAPGISLEGDAFPPVRARIVIRFTSVGVSLTHEGSARTACARSPFK